MSTYVEGQVHMLMNKLEQKGFTSDHITKLGQCNRLGDILAFLEGRAEIVMKKAEQVKAVISLLVHVKTITTPKIAGKKTSDCFTNKSRYYYRDSNLDILLPEDQPEQPESQFSVQKLKRSATSKSVAESFLGITGDTATLAKALKERSVITTLPVIEYLVERQEAGEDVGLRTDGSANPFFVENKKGDGEEEASVSVVSVRRDDRRWRVYIYPLGGGDVWFAERRFFFRNSDTVSL